MADPNLQRLDQIRLTLEPEDQELVDHVRQILLGETPGVREAAARYAKSRTNLMATLFRVALEPQNDQIFQKIDDNV